MSEIIKQSKIDLQKHKCFQCGQSNWAPISWQMQPDNPTHEYHISYEMKFVCICGVKYTLEWESKAKFYGDFGKWERFLKINA